MMADRVHTQRRTLDIAGVLIDVALVKTSGKPKDAKHETRRVGAVSVPPVDGASAAVGPLDDDDQAEALAAAIASTSLSAEPERPAYEHGVTGPGGRWVDLTEQLRRIDAETRLDGAQVVMTVSRRWVPFERVRDSYYVTPGGGQARDGLTRLADALAGAGRAAVVRWTKTTNQAIGYLVPQGRGHSVYLILYEGEFTENMRPIPDSAILDRKGLPDANEAASRLVGALDRTLLEMDDVHDERIARRAALLNAAREGRPLPTATPDLSTVPASVADAFAASIG